MSGPKIDRGASVQHAGGGEAPKPKEAEGAEKSTRTEGSDEGKSRPAEAQKERESSGFEDPRAKGPVDLQGGTRTRPGEPYEFEPEHATRPMAREDAERVLNQTEEGKKVLAELGDLEQNHGVKVTFESQPDLRLRGQYDPRTNEVLVNSYYTTTPNQSATTLAHEVEHAHQWLGTQPDRAGPPANPNTPGMTREGYVAARATEEAHAESRAIEVANATGVHTSGSGAPLHDIYNSAYAARNGTPEENRQAAVDAVRDTIQRGEIWPQVTREAGASWDQWTQWNQMQAGAY